MEYEKRFSDLCRLLPEVHATEGKRIERFRDGMNWEIRTRISLKNYMSFHEILNDALQVEMELAECPARVEKKGRYEAFGASSQSNSRFQGRSLQLNRPSQGRFSASAARSQFSAPASMPRSLNRFGGSQGSSQGRQSDLECFRCGKRGHRAVNCRTRAVLCYRCNQMGHYASSCL